MKCKPSSLQIVLASNVFPVPGGPNNSIPVLGYTFLLNISGYINGNSIVFIISSLAAACPPTS